MRGLRRRGGRAPALGWLPTAAFAELALERLEVGGAVLEDVVQVLGGHVQRAGAAELLHGAEKLVAAHDDSYREPVAVAVGLRVDARDGRAAQPGARLVRGEAARDRLLGLAADVGGDAQIVAAAQVALDQ